MKKIAVITRTVPGREIFLKRAINSVLDQSYSDFTHVVVVDGPSVNKAKSIISNFALQYKKRNVLVQTEGPYGNMEAATNIGIKSTNSHYIAILDDDDTWERDFLRKTVGYMDANIDTELKGVVTKSMKIVEKVIRSSIIKESSCLYNPEMKAVLLFRVLGENLFPINSFVYERSVLDKIGMYDETLPVLGDWDFNIRFLLRYNAGFIDKPLANYHFRYVDDSVIGNTVTEGIDRHFIYGNMIRNKYLREDLRNSKFGIGYTMASSYADLQHTNKLQELEKRVGEVERKVSSMDNFVTWIRGSLPYRFLRNIRSSFRKI